MGKYIKVLKELAIEKLAEKSTMPRYTIPAPSYTDKTANGLTRCIIDFIKLNGGQAERINVVARMVNGKHVKSTMTKGTADISATIPIEVVLPKDLSNDSVVVSKVGLSVKIEVKIGKDRQSEYQKIYEKDINNAGGIYYIAKDFDSFYEFYKDNF